jgi:hypothetical protein
VVRRIRLARKEQVQRRQTRATLYEACHFVRQHGAQPVAEKRKWLHTWFKLTPFVSHFQQRKSGTFRELAGAVHVPT